MSKTNQILAVFLIFSAALCLSSQGFSETTAGPVETITANDGKFKTTVEFSSSVPLELFESGYAIEQPQLLTVTLKGSTAGRNPEINLRSTSFVLDIRSESDPEGHLRFLLQLKESIPYSIFLADTGLTLELYRIQPPQGGNFPDDELADTIAQRQGHTTFLEDISLVQNRDAAVIRAELTDTAVYNIFTLNNPLRLVVDLFNTIHSRAKSKQTVQAFGLKEVRSSQFQVGDPLDIARIVFDLEDASFFQVEPGPDEIKFTFPRPSQTLVGELGQEAPDEEAAVRAVDPAPVPENHEAPQPDPPPAAQDNSEDTESIEIQAEPPHETPSQVSPAQKSQDDERPAIEPIKEMSVQPETPTKTELEATAAIPPPLPAQEQYTPRTLDQTEQAFSGELISPVFRDADLRDVILYLGNSFGFNVVFGPDVRGTVTCDFKDIPWDQFIDIILKVNKMGRIIEGNILRIAPIDSLTREQQDQRKLEESRELASPVITRSYRLSYAKAGEIQTLIQTRLSDRGEIVIDSRTNTLIITDVSDRLALLERLVNELDEANLQVSIEARVVEASSTFVRNIGIQWGWRGISDPFYGNQTALQFPNRVLVDGSQIPTGITTRGIGGPLGGYAINLPAPAFTTAVGLSMSNVLDTFRIDMAISALESSGNGRIISSPNIVTQNNKPAEIIQGRQIPVQTAANFTVTTRYQNAALELRATPQITAKNTIIMILEIKNDAPDFANLVQGIPPITTQSAKTTVEIPDGGTTVIGGIYRHEDSITKERVPLLHKIPLLGNLFRSFSRTKQSRELLIFITPRIIRQ